MFLDRLDFQILLRLLQAFHTIAFSCLHILLCALYPCTQIYLKSWTSSSKLGSCVGIFVTVCCLNAMIFVFFAFMCNPTCRAAVSSLLRIFWTCSAASENNAMSSAKSRSVMFRGPTLLLCLGYMVNPRSSSLLSIAVRK